MRHTLLKLFFFKLLLIVITPAMCMGTQRTTIEKNIVYSKMEAPFEEGFSKELSELREASLVSNTKKSIKGENHKSSSTKKNSKNESLKRKINILLAFSFAFFSISVVSLIKVFFYSSFLLYQISIGVFVFAVLLSLFLSFWGYFKTKKNTDFEAKKKWFGALVIASSIMLLFFGISCLVFWILIRMGM